MSDPWWPVSHGQRPAFQVKRPSYGESIGGDYVRGSTVEALPNAVLKYPTSDETLRAGVQGKALLYTNAFNYTTVRIEWDWPTEDGGTWNEIALVRSAFGIPTTPNDGQTVFRSMRAAFEDADGNLMVSPVIFDEELPGGRWYYYTLFFNISPHAPTLGDWVAGFSDSAQLPLRFGHADHLFNGVPPYYQWTDESYRPGAGFLRQFFDIFGFELDYTRQSIEFMQDMYHVDLSPMPLLRQIGRNHGLIEEQGLGDIRFRALVADLPDRLKIRGTQDALQQSIETMSKYDSEVTRGVNLMLLPDDSDAFFSTGNWAGPHPAMTPPDPVLTWDQVALSVEPPDAGIPGGAQGFLRISGVDDVAGDILLTCGCGWIDPPALEHPDNNVTVPGEYIPLLNGIPVKPTGAYGFAAYLRNEDAAIAPVLVMLWFGKSGKPADLVAVTSGIPPSGGTTTGWDARHRVQDTCPDDAYYMVPAIHIPGRGATYVDMTAAIVYLVQRPGQGLTVTPPDRLLTLGDPNERIGAPPDPGDPGFTGFVMGKPGSTA